MLCLKIPILFSVEMPISFPGPGWPVFSSLIRGTIANAFSSEQVADLSFFAPSEIMQNPPLLSPLAGCTVKLSRVHRRNDSSGNDAIGDLCSAIREGRGDDALSVVRENNHSLQWIDSLDDPSVNDLIYAGFESLQCCPCTGICTRRTWSL